jgi:hypothetical protein
MKRFQDMSPSLAAQLMALALLAVLVLHINHRFAGEGVRGDSSLEPVGLGILVVYGAALVMTSRFSRDRGVQYVFVVFTGLVMLLAYVLGTARFD